MKPEFGFIKVKQYAQGKSDASGWNKHVNKFQKRIANKVVRRLLKRDNEGLDRKYR
ncbi:MAG: hypothetical protein HY874_11385 [Chloroflexi bacterium]|nr:hypothetical protein [Chloroflexota bacterium]